MNGQPDAWRIAAGMIDPMAGSGRDQNEVTRGHSAGLGIGEAERRLALQQHNPLVLVLFEPSARRGGLAGGNDPLDPQVRSLEQGVEKFLRW